MGKSCCSQLYLRLTFFYNMETELAQPTSRREYEVYYQFDDGPAFVIRKIKYETFAKLLGNDEARKDFLLSFCEIFPDVHPGNYTRLYFSFDGIRYSMIENLDEDKCNNEMDTWTAGHDDDKTSRVIEPTSSQQDSQVTSSQDFENSGTEENLVPVKMKNLQQLLNQCQNQLIFSGNYFTLDVERSFVNGESITARCNACPQNSKPYLGSVNTARNFLNHLEKKHPDVARKYMDEKQNVKKARHRSRNRMSMTKNLQNKFATNVTNFFVASFCGFRCSELPEFKTLINDLQMHSTIKVKHVSRNVIARKAIQAYDKMKAEIKQELDNTEFVSTTSDFWTGFGRTFLGMTCHWIDEKTLSRRSLALACRRFFGKKTYDRVAQKISEIHRGFGLVGPKLLATTTDHASYFMKAFRLFGFSVEDEDFQDDENSMEEETEYEGDNDDAVTLPEHVLCSDHGLNLIATTDFENSLKDNKELQDLHGKVLGKCKKLWRANKSGDNREQIVAYLGQALPYPVLTRWTSLYESLQSIIDNEGKFFSSNWQKKTGLKQWFTNDDMDYLKEYVRVMQPLMQVLHNLQGEKQCFYGFLMPNLITLQRTWNKINTEVLVYIHPLLQDMIAGLNRRYADYFAYEGVGLKAAVATALHPEFKLTWIKNSEHKKTVQDAVIAAISEFPEAVANVVDNFVEDRFDFGDETDSQPVAPQQASAELIVLRYMQEPRSADLAVLHSHPLMKKLFIITNTPLPSEAPSERLFSYATLMELPKFNRLSDSNFENRVLLKVNGKLRQTILNNMEL